MTSDAAAMRLQIAAHRVEPFLHAPARVPALRIRDAQRVRERGEAACDRAARSGKR